MKLKHKLGEYTAIITNYLHSKGMTVDDIHYGYEAWEVAATAGVTSDAYNLGRDVYDAHIQTVLEKVFPNARFKSTKRY